MARVTAAAAVTTIATLLHAITIAVAIAAAITTATVPLPPALPLPLPLPQSLPLPLPTLPVLLATSDHTTCPFRPCTSLSVSPRTADRVEKHDDSGRPIR